MDYLQTVILQKDIRFMSEFYVVSDLYKNKHFNVYERG